MRYLVDCQPFPDRNGPWYEEQFTEQAVRQRSALKGRTLPDLIEIERQRHLGGWLINVWEVAESGDTGNVSDGR